MGLWGTQAAYPELKFTDLLTEEGAKVADQLSSHKCVHVMADSFNYAYGEKYKSLVNPQASNSSAWIKAFVDGSVKPVKPVAPDVCDRSECSESSAARRANTLYNPWRFYSHVF